MFKLFVPGVNCEPLASKTLIIIIYELPAVLSTNSSKSASSLRFLNTKLAALEDPPPEVILEFKSVWTLSLFL